MVRLTKLGGVSRPIPNKPAAAAAAPAGGVVVTEEPVPAAMPAASAVPVLGDFPFMAGACAMDPLEAFHRGDFGFFK